MSNNWDGYFWKSWEAAGELHVAGVLKAPSPGYAVTMKRAVSGINPRILMLELTWKELPGAWPDVLTEVPVTLSIAPYNSQYDQVTVRGGSAGPSGGITVDIIKTGKPVRPGAA